jgi:hypothetical protein
VAQLHATIAHLGEHALVREEGVRAHLTAVNDQLATSTAHVSTLESDLRVANSSLETSMPKMENLEATLESTKKLLESSHVEGKLAFEAQLKLKAQADTDALNLHRTAVKMSRALMELQLLPGPVPAGSVSEISP